MDETRDHLLTVLQQRRQATARELAPELKVTEATVRRHLEGLLRDGKVSRSVERGGPGRPNHIFTALGEAPAPPPSGLQRLVTGLLFEAEGLNPAELRGLDAGHNLAAVLVDRLAHRMVLRHAPRLLEKRGEERLKETVAVLSEEGYEAGYARGEGADQIALRRCPFGDLARRNPALCSLERRFVAGLLGAEVECTRTIAQGAPECMLAVRAARPLLLLSAPQLGEAERTAAKSS